MACKSFSDKIIKQILRFLHHLKCMRVISTANRPTPSTWRNANNNETFSRIIERDGDRKISKEDELHSLFKWLGGNLTYTQVERAMKDMDEDGTVEYSDFMKVMEMGKDEEEKDEDLRRAFEVFEDGKAGDVCCHITPTGLQLALSRLGEVRSFEECAAMIRAYDLDGDGVLDFHEFRTMMIR